MTLPQQTAERLFVGLTINQIVLFPDGEHVHIFVSPTGDYECTSIITIQATDDGLEVDVVGPDAAELPDQSPDLLDTDDQT